MPKLPQEKIDEIRSSVDIVDVVGEYLPLHKSGRNYKAICPFHEDTNPSLVVSPERQICNCFVCHTGGNVFTFLMKYLHISYIESVKMCADKAGIDVSEYTMSAKPVQVDERKAPLYSMYSEASKIYNHYLHTRLGLAAMEYLEGRHLSKDVIEHFNIGYALNESTLFETFTKQGYKPMDIYRSGLVLENNSQRNSTPRDLFRDRIMFPLHDLQGNVVAFSGRIYHKGEPKYINSLESDIFIKSEVLYNYHNVKDHVREKGYVIVCEGFMDVIALYRAGIYNAVAIMGTAFTSQHINALKRLTNTIYLCLDGDKAGQNATVKCLKSLEGTNMQVKVVELEAGKDPDEYLEAYGPETLAIAIDKALSTIQFEMNYYYLNMNLNNYDERKKYLELMVERIAKIEDIVDRDYYVGLLEEKSGFSKDTIYNLLNHTNAKITSEPIRRSYPVTKQMINKYQKAQRDLLFYMLEDKRVADIYEDRGAYMANEIYRAIAGYIVEFYYDHYNMDIAKLIDKIKYEDSNNDQSDLLCQNILEISQLNLPPLDEENEQMIDDYLSTIHQEFVNQHIEELKELLSKTSDNREKAKIALEIIELKEREKENG